MTLSVTLSAEAEAKLKQKAASSGVPLDAYASQLLEDAAKSQTVDEVLEPFRKQVAQSGMSDQQVDEFFETVRENAYRDRRRRPA